jgi:hypothetical protein
VRRQLCHALLIETGARVRDVIPVAGSIDFIVETVPLWRPRRVRVRLLDGGAGDDDGRRLREVSDASGDAEAILIETAASQQKASMPSEIMLVRASEFLERLEASALITWTGGAPSVDLQLFEFLRRREGVVARLDAVGVQWLPWLGRNKIPLRLREVGAPADALLEDAVFRTFTMVFRFLGERLGVRQPGTVNPDSLLFLPTGCSAAVLDCKAARDGYRMSANDQRALYDYVGRAGPRAAASNATVGFVVVVSGSFSGSTDARHPFFGRARAFRRDLGVQLVYVSTDDLARFALSVEEREVDPGTRARIAWDAAFAMGRPTHADFLELLP